MRPFTLWLYQLLTHIARSFQRFSVLGKPLQERSADSSVLEFGDNRSAGRTELGLLTLLASAAARRGPALIQLDCLADFLYSGLCCDPSGAAFNVSRILSSRLLFYRKTFCDPEGGFHLALLFHLMRRFSAINSEGIHFP